MNVSSPTTTSTSFSKDLLSWYDQNGRELLWRGLSDPYAIWLSEIIMQQTQVATGTAYWERFMAQFPTVEHLAVADREEVLSLWQGLGYYRRAHLLHDGAQVIHNTGAFPDSAKAWRDIPGVGPYTSAAIASITLNEVIPAIDGNAQRVYSRIFDLDIPVDRSLGAQTLESMALALMAQNRPGDHNQAIMDLGAHVCKPTPNCGDCPVSSHCASRAHGTVMQRPIKKNRVKVQSEDWHFAWAVDRDHVTVVIRDAGGIWPGLHCLPMLDGAPINSRHTWRISHKLTHKNLTLHIHEVDADLGADLDGKNKVHLEALGTCNWPKPFLRWLEKKKYI